jgi:hypothetical protein
MKKGIDYPEGRKMPGVPILGKPRFSPANHCNEVWLSKPLNPIARRTRFVNGGSGMSDFRLANRLSN